MTDILIRNVPEDVVKRLDARAASLGLSRNEYLNRYLASEAARSDETVEVRDFEKFAALADDDLMREAWS